MRAILQAGYDKLLIGLALAAMTANYGWIRWQRDTLAQLQRTPMEVDFAGPAYTIAGQWPAANRAVPWAGPAAQSAGSEWLYEIFTPPGIFYDAPAKSFAILAAKPATGDSSFGLELLEVKFEPYRLQLVGYFGEPGDYLAAFVCPDRPGTFLARSGHRFKELGLTFKSLEVRKVTVASTDAGPVHEVAALAVLVDEKTGMEVLLDSRARTFTDLPVAVVRLAGTGESPRMLRVGDVFSTDTAAYRIERIQFDPSEVVVTKMAAGPSQAETAVLRPGKVTAQRPPGKLVETASASAPSRLDPTAAGP